MFKIGLYTDIHNDCQLNSYLTVGEIDVFSKTLNIDKNKNYQLIYSHKLHPTIKDSLYALNLTTHQDIILYESKNLLEQLDTMVDIIIYFKLDIISTASQPYIETATNINNVIIHYVYLPSETI
jgi:hypothetical protein